MSAAPSEDTATGFRPTRRGLVRGAVWTVPAIAAVSAAPAYAASVCAPVTVDFNAFPTNQEVPSGSSATYGGVQVTLTYTGATEADNNATIFQTTSSSKELRFYDPNATNTANTATAQTIKIDFSRQVKNLTLTLIDIDYVSGSYDDRVVVNTAGYTGTKGSGITGAGTSGSPYRASAQAVDGATTNNVALTWVSATSVNFTYSQAGSSVSGSPHIGIRSIVFTPTSC